MEIQKKIEKLTILIFDTREEMGKAAAEDAGRRINAIIDEKGEANVVFAAAPSQNDLLENLLEQDIDWSKVRGFHQDEYVGIDESEPAGFGNFLDRAIFKKVPFMEQHYLLCGAEEAEAKCAEYSELVIWLLTILTQRILKIPRWSRSWSWTTCAASSRSMMAVL